MVKVIVLKLPTGSPAPPGYTFVRSTRTLDFYNKSVPTITKSDMDDLASLFGSFGMNANVPIAAAPAEKPAVAIVEDTEVDDLLKAFGGLGVGGRRRKATRKQKRKSRKSKKTRKH
jgi:hypothetical protein